MMLGREDRAARLGPAPRDAAARRGRARAGSAAATSAPRQRVGSSASGATSSSSRSRARSRSARASSCSTSRPARSRAATPAAVRRDPEARPSGVSVIYITHFLEEVREIADRFTVLRDGRTAGTGAVDARRPIERDHRDDGRPPRSASSIRASLAMPGEVVLARRGLAGDQAPRSATLRAARAARSSASPASSARDGPSCCAPSSGSTPCGAARSRRRRRGDARRTPRARLAQGVGLLTEDRKGEGLALDLPIASQPHALAPRSRRAALGWLNLARRDRAARATGSTGSAIRARGAAPARRRALRRQPAEGRARAAAPPRRRRAPARRADARHRRREQGRDLPPHRRARRARQGDRVRELATCPSCSASATASR